MSALHLENIPDELYQRIDQLARAAHVSVSEEAVRLLQQAVNTKAVPVRADVAEMLENIHRNMMAPAPGTPDSVEMLREDRAR